MAWQNRFSGAKLAEMKNAFSLFDRDGDGTISTKELASVFKSLGAQASEQQLQAMIRAADTDGSGTVEFNEFMELMADTMEVTEEEMMESFKLFDRDGSGTINHNEIKLLTRTGMGT
ncbi:calmodulin [Eurytemora carolleeae]|uniref:calmodulin n=1 Tax=Eurytemora carolleeae TaxID=1294199 RepID=UPI000C7850E8|nr:calmodulin [Eurytemora carolleeae]|eukprot:XP_023341924.1 calmodulin-like [Eurytemora affinis]